MLLCEPSSHPSFLHPSFFLLPLFPSLQPSLTGPTFGFLFYCIHLLSPKSLPLLYWIISAGGERWTGHTASSRDTQSGDKGDPKWQASLYLEHTQKCLYFPQKHTLPQSPPLTSHPMTFSLRPGSTASDILQTSLVDIPTRLVWGQIGYGLVLKVQR